MKYLMRKIYLLKRMRKMVKGDRIRTKENTELIWYFVLHPHLWLSQECISCPMDKRHIEKGINCIQTAPYDDEAFEVYK